MKVRYFIIPFILLLSLGLVTITLAAADSAAEAVVPKAESVAAGAAARPPAINGPSDPDLNGNVPDSPNLPTGGGEWVGIPVSASRPPQTQATSQSMLEQAMSASRQPARSFNLDGNAVASREAGFARGVTSPEAVPPGITVDLYYDRIYGYIDPGALITITRSGDGSYGAALADGVGFFWTPLFLDGIQYGLNAGDELEIWQAGGSQVVIIPAEPVGSLDLVTDQVTGAIPGDTGGTVVTVTLGLWNWPGDVFPTYTAVTQPDGSFSINLSVDAGAENFAVLTYSSGSLNVRTYLFPDPHAFLVQYNSIAGYAPVNTPVTATVYITYPSDVRWWGTGFAEWPLGFYWIGDVDVAPGDVVVLDYEDGSSAMTTIRNLGNLSFDTGLEQVYGEAPAGEILRLNISEWQAGSYNYIEEHTVAGPNDRFTATFTTVDFSPSNLVDIIIADGNGNQTHMVSGPPYMDVQLSARDEWDCVIGRVDGPNLPFTISVQTASGTFTRTHPLPPSDPGNLAGGYGSCFLVWGDDWGPINFSPGDVVTLQSPTWVGQVTVPDITWEADTANDQVSGSAPEGEVDVSVSQWNSGQYPTNGGASLRTTSDGAYTAAFPAFDVRDGGGEVIVRHFDPASDFSAYLYDYTYILQVEAPWGVWGSTPIPDEPMTAWLYDEAHNPLASTSNDGDEDPYNFWFWFDGYEVQPGFWVTVTGQSGWEAGMQVPEVTIDADEATDMIWGEAPKSLLFLEGYGYESGFSQFAPVDGYALDTSWLGYDLQWGDEVYVYYSTPEGSRARTWYRLGELFQVEFWLELNGDTSMWGQAQPGTTVTITTPYTQVTAYADPQCQGCWDVYAGELYPGDTVIAEAGAGLLPVNITIPDPLSANADAQLDQVWGQIGGWISRTVQVHGGWPDGYQEVTSDPDGNYLAVYPDIPPGAQGYIRFEEPIDYTWVVYHRPFRDLTPVFRANYAHEWVEGNYDPGHTLWITLTDSGGAVKATATGVTGPIPWWGGQSGFSTGYNLFWSPFNPDLQSDDWVFVLADNGLVASTRLGVITGVLDILSDTVSGNVYAPWFTQTLQGDCGVWMENGPGMGFEVDPDGGSYFCDFADLGWDLLPGQDVGVSYHGTDGNQVINVFREPAPDMRVEKWVDGSGQVMPGGPVVFGIYYRNEGDAAADTFTITDTLPANTTYLTDTSGAPVTFGPGYVVWTFDTLDPGQEDWFYLILHNTANPGDTLLNQVQVHTQYDFNYGNDYSEAEAYVVDEYPNLYVNKNPNPGDPAPGQTFLWEIGYGNNGPVASGPVLLTDTLPLSTTVVDWFSENGYDLWSDVSSADQFVLEAPSIPGYWGDRILLRLLVDPDVPYGTQLTNTVEITTAWDTNPGDNWHMRNDVWVSEPRWDAGVYKDFNWGRLYPGGEIEYHLSMNNHGNMETQTWMTDTLPEGTSFVEAWSWFRGQYMPFPPDYVDDEIAYWDLGVMQPGEWVGIDLRLAISQSVVPETTITNCAEIVTDGADNWPYNDSDCVVDTVRDYGPNLRVIKDYWWDWEGQLGYEIRVENIGSQWLGDVIFTDTYPLSTTFNDNWWVNHGPWITVTHDAGNRQLIFWAEGFDPGETASIGFRVDLDGEIIGQQGLAFTNMVAAPIPDDIYPEDNYAEVVAYTGPDVYIEKWLSGGEPRPGEVVTFTVEFGNANQWPWDGDYEYGSHITDTLPAEMTFITATAPWNPDDFWYPEVITDHTIVWGWGTMWSNSTWFYDIVVQIADTVEGGDVITNVIEAYGDSPYDIEPNWDNNVFALPVTILNPKFEVEKSYAGNDVAGTALSYTLTVNNVGSEAGTNVILSDTLPANLTFGGTDGSWDGTDLTWSFASIPADGSGTGWFSGTLACTPGLSVDNVDYRVVGSDQGVISPDGAPVSLTILSPTIVASFDVSAGTVLPNVTVYFTDTSTTDGTALTYAWDFGDGGTGSGATASHAFTSPGSYLVTLTVTDGCGFTGTHVVTIEVSYLNIYLPIVIRE